jgi:Fe-S cluster biogenesis protein NfuA
MSSPDLMEALDQVNRRLAAHAGGVRLEGVSNAGVLRLRFTGMCAGCLIKPLTMSTVVEPALERVEGVTGIEMPGARVSPAAAARLARVRGCPPPEGASR